MENDYGLLEFLSDTRTSQNRKIYVLEFRT